MSEYSQVGKLAVIFDITLGSQVGKFAVIFDITLTIICCLKVLCRFHVFNISASTRYDDFVNIIYLFAGYDHHTYPCFNCLF
ncbi:hypothetical protein GQ55_9G346500 [Panicum hallii var. hallii]|uniref:Uncharacterized protein n=1 Tax=Panicum hallii var. hallii TaxID=1504633 RepID=A0A2T7C8J1_9POAL|nr:hypothetical protein GQ55_9G346500 [Panicum hallii var. hallii]